MEMGGGSPGWNGKKGEGDPYVHLWKRGCPDVEEQGAPPVKWVGNPM